MDATNIHKLNEELITHCLTGNAIKVQSLLKAGANVNSRDRVRDETPLMYAVHKNRTVIVALLIEAGANLNLCNKDGYTALMFASLKNYHGIVKLLAQGNLNLKLRNEDGFNALDLASMNGHLRVVKLLIKQPGVNINEIDIHQRTPLMHAAEGNHTETVALLIKYGASLNVKDAKGHTALVHGYARQMVEETAFCLLSAMSPEQIEREVIDCPQLKHIVEQFKKAIRLQQNTLFDLLACSLIIDMKTASPFKNQEAEIIASFLTFKFPEWYANKMVRDIKCMVGVGLEREKLALRQMPAVFLPGFINQSQVEINKEQEIELVNQSVQVTKLKNVDMT